MLYPFSRKISAIVPLSDGILPSQPGKPADKIVCENPLSCTLPEFLPVNNAARVGAQIAVV
ncbi:hypothetical protein D3C86_1905010 [compost metagenome]